MPEVDLQAQERLSQVSCRWRLDWVAFAIAVAGICGLGVALYPLTASWVSAHNQAVDVRGYRAAVSRNFSDDGVLARAREYNDQMWQAAILASGSNVPSAAVGEAALRYEDMLKFPDTEVMARITVPTADIDLPVFHGTTAETLRKGAGHLQGTALPVGGAGTHSVLTAHRGLASSALFNRLDEVTVGDIFEIEVAGDELTYEVISTRVVGPEQTEEIVPAPGEDLVSLVTCTPIGVNSHRIVVTGTRVQGGVGPGIGASAAVGFPWWAVVGGAGIVVGGGYVWFAGRPTKSARAK